MTCVRCGAELPEGARFCGSCGADQTPRCPSSAAEVTKVRSAMSAAGCTLAAARSGGRGHTTGSVRYNTYPPSSGPHNPVPALDGVKKDFCAGKIKYQVGFRPKPDPCNQSRS